jgi:hypothetical protein
VKMSPAERCFPCLALGRHWASRYRQRWSRSRPKHRRPLRPLRTPLRPPPAPLRPPEHAGGIGGHRDAPLAISDGARATATLLHPLQQLQQLQLQRNSDPRWAHPRLAQTKRAAQSRPLAVRDGTPIPRLRSPGAPGGPLEPLYDRDSGRASPRVEQPLAGPQLAQPAPATEDRFLVLLARSLGRSPISESAMVSLETMAFAPIRRDPISRKARAAPQCDGKMDIKTKSLSYLT